MLLLEVILEVKIIPLFAERTKECLAQTLGWGNYTTLQEQTRKINPALFITW